MEKLKAALERLDCGLDALEQTLKQRKQIDAGAKTKLSAQLTELEAARFKAEAQLQQNSGKQKMIASRVDVAIKRLEEILGENTKLSGSPIPAASTAMPVKNKATPEKGSGNAAR